MLSIMIGSFKLCLTYQLIVFWICMILVNFILNISLLALRCSLQYLGNMAAGNRDSQDRIWNLAFPSVFL